MLKEKRYEGEGVGPAVESDHIGGNQLDSLCPLAASAITAIVTSVTTTSTATVAASIKQQQQGYGFEVGPGASLAFFPGPLGALAGLPITTSNIQTPTATATITTKVIKNVNYNINYRFYVSIIY